MDFSERALVLRVGKFREADLWLQMLSPSRGLIRAFAFGGSRSRRRFVGCLDILNELSVRIGGSGGNKYQTLKEAALVSGVRRLRNDWPRLGLAMNCVRFLISFGAGAEEAGETYFVMRETIRLLEESDGIPASLPFLFRARLAFDHGYALNAETCRACGKLLGQGFLFPREGCILCPACASGPPGQRLFLGTDALRALALIRLLPPTDWPELALSPEGARECARAVDGFIQHHVGLAWDKGRFVKA